MAVTIRQRGAKYEVRLTHPKRMKPMYFRAEKRSDCVEWAQLQTEKIDLGLDTPGYEDDGDRRERRTVNQALRDYRKVVAISAADQSYLDVVSKRVGTDPVRGCDYKWAQDWVTRMKRVHKLTPTTIKHQVGALARCFDWMVRSDDLCELPRGNILRTLPVRYAHFTEEDMAVVGGDRANNERERRLNPEEEVEIRRILAGGVPRSGRELELKWRGALTCMFDLAIETAMRLRETYTLDLTEVSLPKHTIFLDKTKNGDRRQVPLSTTAIAAIRLYLKQVKTGEAGMKGFAHIGERLFPWGDGVPSKESLKATTALLSREFARLFAAAGCGDLRYHDLRHEATSRLFEKTDLDMLKIAKITGHRNPRMLMRYTNLRGSDLAKRLG